MVRLRDLQSGMIFKKGKKRRELTLASVFILTFVWIWPVECFLQRPQTGDLKFVGDDSARYKGRVSIYIDPKDSTEGWGTINGKGISIVEGNVICRQLGYTKAKEAYNADTHNGMNKYTINETGVPVWIEESGLHCDSENLLHIMRCISGWRGISRHPISLDHSSDFIVVCDQESISTEHYDKQVFINSTEGSFNYSSAGEILLYLDKMPHWGTVGIGKETNNPFSVNGANAVCRQLGYTSAAYFAKGHRSIDVTWFKGGEKCHSPVNCFSCCFEYPKDYCHDCHLDDTVYIQCTFDISAMDYYTAGGGASCGTERPGSNSCSNKGDSPATIAMGITIAVLILLLILVALFSVYICIQFYRRRGYNQTNN